MVNHKHTLIFIIILSIFISCGKTEKKEETPISNATEQKNEQKTIEKDSISPNTETTFQTPKDSINEVTGSVLGNQNYKRKEGTLVSNDTTKTYPENNNNTTPTVKPTKKPTKPSFVYIKKILNECETGVTMTQEDLEAKFKIPKEAMKLVKSVTKTAPDELEIKWKSTWLVEKISDAKFKDGKLKMRFEDNKMYTSGGAISIKYEKKLYSDLILIGRAAYIPTVKGFYWQIGNGK